MTKPKAKRGQVSLAIQAALVTAIVMTLIPLATPPRVVQVTVSSQMAHSPSSNRALARQMASAYGWRGQQWQCLDTLWGKRESGFRHTARNEQGSSAYGIAQLLNEQSKEPAVQIVRGLRYIQARYETPCRALRFHDRKKYY